jgi:TolA-binding protein
MKKSVLILAMLLMAATAFTQTSRRTANSHKPAREEQTKKTSVKSQRTGNKSISVQKNSNVKQNTTHRQSANQVSKSTSVSNRSKAHQQERRTSAGSTEARQEIRRTATGGTADRSDRSEGNVRRSNVSTAGNPSSKATPANNKKQSTHVAPDHSRTHGSVSGKTGAKHVTHYKSPRLYHGSRTVRYHYNVAPRSRLYRSRHFPYRIPGHIEIYWTPALRREYIRIYPMVKIWRYPVGYRIQTISAYDALFYHGEVMNVYGKVYEVFYSRETDEYVLYFGAYYPHHDLSVVVPGWIARRMSRRPEVFFERQHVVVTGLITSFDDKPEIVVRNTGQLRIY